jgi:predicted permease
VRIERWFHSLPLRLRSLFRRRRVERELDEEIRDHIERQAAANVAAGMPAGDARRAALRAFGGIERRKDDVRDTRGVALIENLLHDIQYAARILRKSPGFTTVAVLTLALGIGANAAIFGIVQSVLLRPRPYPHADRLVALFETDSHGTLLGLSKLDLQDWQPAATTVAHLAASIGDAFPISRDGHRPAVVYGALASVNFFDVFGVAPILGTGLTTVDGGVVIGEALWKQWFDGAPDIVGKTLIVNDTARVINGVMPSRFDYPHGAELWVPQDMTPKVRTARTIRAWQIVADLKPGVTVSAAQAEFSAIAARLAAAYPGTNAGVGARVMELEESLTGKVRPTLVLLTVMAGLVLLIACSNLANLMLARAVGRRRELAVRAALGASRGRIARQLMTESLLLSAIGAALGIPVALWCAGALRATPTIATLPFATHTSEWWVFGFSVLMALVTTLLFGTAPALRAARVDVVTNLKQAAGRGITAIGMSGALVAGEVAVATLLLIGAALTGRSLARLEGESLGFDPNHLVILNSGLPGTVDGAARLAAEENLLARARALPGVTAAAVTNVPPLSGRLYDLTAVVEGEPVGDRAAWHHVLLRIASDGFFRTLDIPITRGRDFLPTDDRSAPTVLINEAMARALWPGRDAIGARVALPELDPDWWMAYSKGEKHWLTVVGVVGDTREVGLGIPPQPEVYASIFVQPSIPLEVVARTPLPLSAVRRPLLAAAAAINGGSSASVTTMNDVTLRSVATPRVRTFIVIAFAGLALMLATVGVYGVASHMTVQRTAEIGIRMALGARPAQVLGAVAGRVIACAGIGLGVGLIAALASVHLVRAFLYGIGPYDFVTFAAAGLMVVLVAGVATWVPARRATRIDPTEALRAE